MLAITRRGESCPRRQHSTPSALLHVYALLYTVVLVCRYVHSVGGPRGYNQIADSGGRSCDHLAAAAALCVKTTTMK